MASRDIRLSRRDSYVGTVTREEKSSLVNRKEWPPEYCRRMQVNKKWKEEGNLLRALGVAPAFLVGERLVWLTAALFANLGSRAGGTVLCTVLTATTPHWGPCALGTGETLPEPTGICTQKPRQEGRSDRHHLFDLKAQHPCRELMLTTDSVTAPKTQVPEHLFQAHQNMY